MVRDDGDDTGIEQERTLRHIEVAEYFVRKVDQVR